VTEQLTGYEASSVAEIEAILDDSPADADQVYLDTIGYSERAIAAVAAKRAGGGGGVTPGTVLPVADPAGVTLDTTTYDNTVTGEGKLTTLVFPQDTGQVAIAVAGDDFPRVLLADITDGWYFGDGTADPYNGNAYLNSDKDRISISGLHGLKTNVVVGNSPMGVYFPAQTILFGQSSLSMGTGEPGIGGDVGNIYIRIDPGGANETIYRCTVAGVAGDATWVGIL
jgi:hypothetical protein